MTISMSQNKKIFQWMPRIGFVSYHRCLQCSQRPYIVATSPYFLYSFFHHFVFARARAHSFTYHFMNVCLISSGLFHSIYSHILVRHNTFPLENLIENKKCPRHFFVYAKKKKHQKKAKNRRRKQKWTKPTVNMNEQKNRTNEISRKKII